MSKRQKQPDEASRRRWFDEGAEALQRLLPPGNPYSYLCPICLRLALPAALTFGLLTRDHVPGQRVGGRRLVLTCKDCNSTAGHKMDSEMSHAENVRRFLRGDPEYPTPVLVSATGLPALRGEGIRAGEDGMNFNIVPGQNNPADVERFAKALSADKKIEKSDFPDLQVTLYRDAVRPVAGKVGWLRAAYPTAFAVFGYRYVLRPPLEIVREQIRNPERVVIECFSAVHPTGKDFAPANGIYRVGEPVGLRSFVVRLRPGFWIFLPDEFATDNGLYERLKIASRTKPAAEFRTVGIGYHVPLRPLYLWDRKPDEPRE